MNMQSRLRKLEEKLDMQHGEPLPPPTVCIGLSTPYREEPLLDFPEDVREWVAYRDIFLEANRTGSPVVIFPDRVLEYELRNNMEPGTLTKHELYGKVPFLRLLEMATATAPHGSRSPEGQII